LLLLNSKLYRLYINIFQAYYKLYSYSLDYYLDLKREAIIKIVKEEGSVKLNKEDILNKKDNYPLNTFKILTYY
jgi:hypothetical protein